MPEYTLGSPSGATVDVEADNYLLALGMGLARLGVDLTGHNRWTIVPGAAGALFMEDGTTGTRYVLKPRLKVKMVVARAAPAAEMPSGLPPEDEGLPLEGAGLPPDDAEPPPGTEEVPLPVAPPPMIAMPVSSSLAPPPGASRRQPTDIDSLAERLFDLSTDIAGAPPEEAAQRTLEVLKELIPAEASCVARGSIADFHLTIVAATGPVADQIKGRVVPFGEGYAGLSFDARIPISVNDVTDDARHHAGLDQETGFVTKAVLCVPVLRGDDIFGVIQILNPEHFFIDEDTEIATQVAQTLAVALASAAESLE